MVLRSRPGRPGLNAGVLAPVVAIVLNWFLAAELADPLFGLSSLMLFAWLLLAVARISATAFVMLLPVAITRGATLMSLATIEAGAYMPEVDRLGTPGDASASFLAFTALFFLVFAVLFRALERPFLAAVRSPLLDRLVRFLGWPVVAGCVGLGALAFLHGLRAGFPLLAGVDRFLYRRDYSSPLVLMLLEQKFLVAALLGAIAFRPTASPWLRAGAKATFGGMTLLYFLFGDKFFTILTQATFFAIPLLLADPGRLRAVMVRTLPLALCLLCGSLGATLYIYSDYGRQPAGRAITRIGERIAGQGELWYVASRDFRAVARWDQTLVRQQDAGLEDVSPSGSAFANGVDTFWFIQRYAPAKLGASIRRNGGWVQFTMGTEAMGLVMFGYAGLAVVMLFMGVLTALALLFLRRSYASGFPLSQFCAGWTFLQIYNFIQQGSWWAVAAPGQAKRLLLFVTIELVLLAVNRGQLRALAARARSFRRVAPPPGAAQLPLMPM